MPDPAVMPTPPSTPTAVVTFVRFATPGPPLDPAALRALLERTAPAYREIPGLRRKSFLSAPGVGGGLYEWESRDHAERWFTPAWRGRMLSMYGAVPQVEWFEVPCLVDNERGTIELQVPPAEGR